jgi:hypothetical protein
MLRERPPARARTEARSAQNWTTFVRNHAQAMLARDFFQVVTASFRIPYVFVILEVGIAEDPAP